MYISQLHFDPNDGEISQKADAAVLQYLEDIVVRAVGVPKR